MEERARAAADNAASSLRAALGAAAGTQPEAAGWAAVCSEALGAALVQYETDAIADGRAAERRAALLASLSHEVRAFRAALRH